MNKKILDVCCGSRMFWFDRKDDRAVFVDKRCERHQLKDRSSTGGSRELVIDPDYVADFTELPFDDNSFSLVVFDPPHFVRNGEKSWVGLKNTGRFLPAGLICFAQASLNALGFCGRTEFWFLNGVPTTYRCRAFLHLRRRSRFLVIEAGNNKRRIGSVS